MLSRSALASCRRQHNAVLRRSLATEVVSEPSSSSQPVPVPTKQTKRPPRAAITAAVILNRSPILTRTPSLFERAYYSYQARIRRALHSPFPVDFYFKQGSLLEIKFNLEEKKRERRAFGAKFKTEEEFVSQEKAAANKAAADQLALQEEDDKLMPRVHEADINRDYKSLDRKGRRNIYLLLHTKVDGKEIWRFPQGGVEKGELLHQAAQRDLYAECGDKMDTWIVSRNPVGVYKESPLDISLREPKAEKITFFFKGHILAGQVHPNPTIISDFAWLTKQEIETRVEKDYWEGVKDILSDY